VKAASKLSQNLRMGMLQFWRASSVQEQYFKKLKPAVGDYRSCNPREKVSRCGVRLELETG